MTSASTEDIESTPAPTAKRRLWDIQPTRVDVVDAPANLEPWIVVKSEGSMSEVQTEENLLDVLAGIKQDLLALKESQTSAPVAELAVEVEKASAGPVIREVAERVTSLAAAMEEGEPDGKKLNAEVEALVALLVGVIEKYPAPENTEQPPATDAYPEPVAKACAEGKCMGAAALREVADKAMALAMALDSETPPDQAMMIEEVKWLITALQATAEKYPPIEVQDACASSEEEEDKKEMHKAIPEALQKAAIDLYALYTEFKNNGSLDILKNVTAIQSSVPTLMEVAKAETVALVDAQQIENLLCTAIAKAGAIAAIWSVEVCSEQRDLDFAALAFALETLTKSCPAPEVKAAETIAEAIKDLIQKADGVAAQQCSEADLTVLAQARAVIDAVQAKYVDVQKAANMDITDMASLFSANRMLDQLNSGLLKLGYVAKDADAANDAETAKTADAAPVDVGFETAFKALNDKVDALIESLSKPNKTDVTKSVDTIPGPAAAGMKSAGTKPVDDFPACPDNYNDPAYRAMLKARGLDLGRR